ncbi:MAG: sugar ABC transporter permease [Lachnospiraceae bacterium]|nr:sugar ABC transporter permease [Lachnospiraceae bacterium]
MKKKDVINYINVFLFLLPALALFIFILIAPIFKSLYYSFFDWNGMTDMTFVGIDNYKELFTSKPIYFWKSLGNACLLAALSVFIQLPISLGFALILGRGIKGERPFLSIYFMPVLISTVVIGQLWLKIYNPDYGLLTVALQKMGFADLCKPWLGDERTALMCVFIPTLWQYVGYHMLLLYAGVKGVSPDIREAARIDGASESQVNRYIVIPSIKPILKVSVIFAVTGSLKSYDLIYVLTPSGGPKHCTEVPSTRLFEMLISRNRYGMGSAIAVVMIILCFAFALMISQAFKERDIYGK